MTVMLSSRLRTCHGKVWAAVSDGSVCKQLVASKKVVISVW